MSSVVQRLTKKGLIRPPKFVESNVCYETIMGSFAYGCSSDTSDVDIYGFCIPPKEIVFPHLAGVIHGFDKQVQKFDQYQQHHVKEKDNKQYDLSIYSIVRYFRLCADCNPNVIDSLFTPIHCVLFSNQIGDMVRSNRKMFLHKGAWFKFKGYAYSQLHKLDTKNPEGKRRETIEKYGYDVKFAYHVVRLLLEIEQILVEGDLTLDRKDRREHLKAIRNGEWSKKQVKQFFDDKERQLEELYHKSTLQYSPDEDKIKQLLIDCLEHHYGSLDKVYIAEDRYENAIRQIEEICERLK